MSYFPDLAPYRYGRHSHPGVVHVGWLDSIHSFPAGSVAVGLIEKMKCLASSPVELYRGFHVCELCSEPSHLVKTTVPNGLVIDPNCSWAQWVAQRRSNGEIRVSSKGVTYAAPVLIVHYIEAHGYLPPVEFLKAIEETIL